VVWDQAIRQALKRSWRRLGRERGGGQTQRTQLEVPDHFCLDLNPVSFSQYRDRSANSLPIVANTAQ